MAKVRAARHYQRRDAAVRRLADAGKRAVRPSLRAAMKALPGMLDMKAATAMITHGRHKEIAHNAIDWHHFQQVLRHTYERLARVYEAGAKLGERKINGAFGARGRKVRYRKSSEALTEEQRRTQGGTFARGTIQGGAPEPVGGIADLIQSLNRPSLEVLFDKAVSDSYSFDRFTPEVQEWLRYQQDELIQQLESDVRDVIEMMIQRGVREGWDTEQIASEIRGVISLTETQANAVLNYRSMLENLDSDALQRQLREAEFDSAVQSAIENDIPLDDAVIDEMVSAYEDNYLDYRSNTIAETEATRMANTGLQQSYEQAIDRGVFPAEAVKQFWQIALDEKTCPICESIPDLNPDGVAMGEEFDSDDGPQDVPPVHPNCRCSIEIVTDLDLVPNEQPQEENA
jgi:hypothetical protein